jgi:polysaccharide biosynthesis protein PslH
MNILLVAPMPPCRTATSAIPRVLHAQLVGLSEHHDVTVAAVAGPEDAELGAVEQLIDDGVDLHAACRYQPQNWQERLRRRRRLAGGWLGGRLPWRSVWYREPGLQLILDRLLAERRFDVIAVEDNAAAIYRYGTSTPTVFTEHEVRRARRPQMPSGLPLELPRAVLAELDWQRWPQYHRSTWRCFDLIQAFTPRDAGAIRALAPELEPRVRINPFGLEIPDALSPTPSWSREVVFVGNFTHRPNVDGALWLGSAIMPRLRTLGAAPRLTVIGPGMPAAVAALACEDIRVTGAVPDLRPYLEAASVVLAPLRIGGGMRMKVLEALALGKAVVSTTRGADGLELTRDSPLVIADTPEAIAAATARLLADPMARATLGGRAREFAARNHSASAYAGRLERVYQEAQELRRAPTES